MKQRENLKLDQESLGASPQALLLKSSSCSCTQYLDMGVKIVAETQTKLHSKKILNANL